MAKPMNLNVLIIEKAKAPYAKEIPNTLKAQQAIVEGLIEPIVLDVKGHREVALIINEEGLINDLPLNRVLHVVSPDGEGYFEYKFHGTMFVVAYDMRDGETVSLTDEEIMDYTARFSGALCVWA